MMRNKIKPSYFIFFYIALFGAVLFTIESWILGPISWIYGYGSGLETIPVFKALSIEGRNFSLWAPFVAGGVDRLAFWGNASPLSLEYFLFSELSTWLANGIHRFLQYFMAIFFTSLVANEQIGFSKKWSCLSGILFACFSYYTVGALFTLSGIPCVLWMLSHCIHQKISIVLLVICAFFVSLMTTFTFGVPYILFFCILWFLVMPRQSWGIQQWGRFIFFSVILILLTTPQLIAIAFNVSLSHRAHWASEPVRMGLNDLFYWQFQFDLFAQDKKLMLLMKRLPIFTLILGLLLSMVSWFQQEERHYVKTFLKVAGIFILLSQKWMFLGLQHVASVLMPFIGGFYMGRFFEVPAPFLLALSVALVLHMCWYQIKDFKVLCLSLKLLIAILVLFMLIEPKVHLFYPLGVYDWGQANYQVPYLEKLKRQNLMPFRVASVLPLQPAYAYAQGLETVDGWANIYPNQYRNYWLKILDPLFKELPDTKEIFGVSSGRAEDNFIFLGADLIRENIGLLPHEDLDQALRTGFDIDRRFNLNLLRLLNTKYLLSEYPLRSQSIVLIHSPDEWPKSVIYRNRNTGLVEEQALLNEEIKRKSFFKRFVDSCKRKLQGKDIFIYEIKDSFERFRFVNNLMFESNSNAILDKLSSMDIQTLKKNAVLKQSSGGNIGDIQLAKSGQIFIRQYTADFIKLDTVLNQVGFLVIGNTWSPYWVVYIDEKKVKFYEVNDIQSGLFVPKGVHHVELKYDPPYQFFRGWL